MESQEFQENQDKQESQENFQQQPLVEHLAELRSCLIFAVSAIFIGFAAAYTCITPLAEWFFAPLVQVMPENKSLIFISYQEGFFFYLKLALVFGVFFACPVWIWQIWRFIAPGLYAHEKKVLVPFTLISIGCFLGGAAFGYSVVFPPAFSFLIGYSSDFLEPMPGVSEYFSLALRLLIAFGVIFELPVFMVFLAKMGVVTKPFLQQYRKYAVLLAFVIAAILTPTPDIVNQLFMAGPLIILYEISILAVGMFARTTFAGFTEEDEPDE